jgi:hypothetical protein
MAKRRPVTAEPDDITGSRVNISATCTSAQLARLSFRILHYSMVCQYMIHLIEGRYEWESFELYQIGAKDMLNCIHIDLVGSRMNYAFVVWCIIR